MKEINIDQTLIKLRKDKGITQDDLARYIGVSKASVSKWETGQSYPDITFLPQLAAYFNISIDDLMGYEPQMTKEDLCMLYHKLSADFVTKPFDEMLWRCREIIKKYYSCFPVLFQIGVLLLNHSMLSGDENKTAEIIAETKALFVKVKKESDDVELAKQALNMEALCLLSLGKPDEVPELLGETQMPLMSSETLLASAYQMTGKATEAKAVLQVGIYQHMLCLFEFLTSYLTLCTDDAERFEESCRRTLAMAEAFQLRSLHPAILMKFYLSSAQGYLTLGNKSAALDSLQNYTQLVTADIYPLQLHGDAYFDLLDPWLADFALGTAPPRDEKTIRQSMVDAVEHNPALAPLAQEKRFAEMLVRLKNDQNDKG